MQQPSTGIDPLTNAPLASPHGQLLSAEYLQLVAFVILVYDHLLTFPDEVEHVWKQRFGGISYLFLINRYITELRYIIILDTFQNPNWTTQAWVSALQMSWGGTLGHLNRCHYYAIFEGIFMIMLYGVAELVMILRVYALYHQSRLVLSFLMTLWTVQMVVSAFGSATGTRIPQVRHGDDGLQCLFSETDPIFAVTWITPLITDCCVFLLTIWKSRYFIRTSRDTPVLHVLGRDGILFFAVVLSANWFNLFLFLAKANDLKVISISVSQVIMSTMISRLVLSLRSTNALREHVFWGGVDGQEIRDGQVVVANGNLKEGFGGGEELELDEFCAARVTVLMRDGLCDEGVGLESDMGREDFGDV